MKSPISSETISLLKSYRFDGDARWSQRALVERGTRLIDPAFPQVLPIMTVAWHLLAPRHKKLHLATKPSAPPIN